MEGVPMVCYSTGTMNSLLDKLSNMTKSPSNTAKEFFKLIENLKGDLERLKRDFLDKFVGQRQKHKQVTVWMKQVRDLLFDIEDWIDVKPETSMVDPSVRQKFEEFKAKIHGTIDRCNRYDLINKLATNEHVPSQFTIDPVLPVEEKTCHCIVDGPRDEIVEHLMDNQMRLKVVSVVGAEGLGKTTLAKEIYAELQLRGQFECEAFVSVGRKPSMRDILDDMLHQVNHSSKKLKPWIAVDVHEIIVELRQYLGTKRYLIVVDGIWSTWAWKVINCALPAKNCGSRVVTTTCIVEVGKFCSRYPSDVVYQMASLSSKNAEVLFSRISGQEGQRAGDFEGVSRDLLNMCGGMPLAIILALGLLARKSKELSELKMLVKSVISSFKQRSMLEGMKQILQISYADLPLPLRSCLLYLSVFPEDCTIKKDRLIRLWGAEGFIPKTDRECLWVTGERYFNELTSRRLIQPVFDYNDDQTVGCTVHSVIFDFLKSLSREENFATRAAELSAGPFPCDTIRRFSLNNTSNKYGDGAGSLFGSTMHLLRMRSLTVFGNASGMFDPALSFVYRDDGEMYCSMEARVTTMSISSFKLMRVLYLEDAKNMSKQHLDCIGELVLLTYLGLRGTGIHFVPKEIGELEKLETLDVRGNTDLLIDIKRFPKLVSLLGDHIHTSEFKGTPEMTELEEVSILTSNDFCTVKKLLSTSKQMKMLGVALGWSKGDPRYFVEVVVKSNLQSLYIDCETSDDDQVGLLLDSWKKVTAPRDVTFKPLRFELILSLRELPPDMAFLLSLTHLRIRVYEVQTKDFAILGGLPNLAHLDLSVHEILSSSTGRQMVEEGAFPCMKVLLFRWRYCAEGLEFQQGSVPQLRRLRLQFRAHDFSHGDGHMVFPVEHLTCLTRVYATIDCIGATAREVETTVAHLRAEMSRNPSKRPTLELALTRQDRMKRSQGSQRQRSSQKPSSQTSWPVHVSDVFFVSKKQVSLSLAGPGSTRWIDEESAVHFGGCM